MGTPGSIRLTLHIASVVRIDRVALLIGVVFSLMWSSAYATARIIVADAPPLTALALRFVIAGLIAVALAKALGQTWRLTAPQWRSTVIFGFCQNGLYLGLNFVALQWIEASLASIIASTMPLLVALLGWLLFRQQVRPLGLAGLCAGMVGVTLIMAARIDGGVDLTGVAMCFVAALALAFATLSVRSASSGGNLLMIVGLQMLVGAGVLAVAAVALESWQVTWTLSLGLAFVYQLLVPGLIATLLWFTLVQRIGAVRASTFHFLNPFFGVAVAALLLGEQIRVLDMIGVGIVMAGILMVQLARQPG